MASGKVIRFNKIKGYGFIALAESEQEVFVHFSEIQLAGYKELVAGQKISFELMDGERGPFATQVKIIE